jgi:predicted dehydrogenase
MLQDYAANPARDLGWRVRRVDAGAGALGDLGSHVIDVARYLCGEITAVCASTRSFVERGPESDRLDDLVAMLVEFDDGSGGVLEASWALRGHRCDLGFDLVCDRGALRFSWERSNEIQVLTGDVDDPTNGYRTMFIGDGQPDVDRFVSVPAQGMGYRDAFTIGLARVLTAIGEGSTTAAPTFADGLAVALVVDAAQRSASERAWAEVEPAVLG